MNNNSLKEHENVDAFEHYSKSQEFKFSYRIEEALQEIKYALDLNPKYAEAYTLRSELYEKMKLYDKALEGLSINNNNAESYYQEVTLNFKIQATIYWRTKLFDQAEKDCLKSIQINTSYAMAYCRIGTIKKDLNQKEEELKNYNQALNIDCNCQKAYICRGLYHMEMKINDQALKDFNQAIQLDPKYVMAYYNRGVLYSQIGENDKALNDYNQVIQLNPKYALAYHFEILDNLYNLIGDKDKALNDYDQAIQLDSKFAKAYMNRGILYNQIGENDKALNDYNQAIQLDPKDAMTYMKRERQSLNDYLQGLSLSPINPLILYNLGDLYYILSDHTQQTLECYQNAIYSFKGVNSIEIAKFYLSQGNINFIKTKIDILKEFEQQKEQSKILIQKLPTENPQHQQIVFNYNTRLQQIQNDIPKILSIPITESIKSEQLQDQNEQLTSILQNIQKLIQELLLIIKDQGQSIQSIQKDVSIQIQQDRNQIELLLNDLNKPENQHQQTYYRFLFQRLYNYLQAMQLISTELLQIYPNAVIDTSSEKVLNIVQNISIIGSVALAPIPIIGDAFQIINAALDIAIDEKNMNKFNKRVRILNEILIQFAVNPQQLEIEVQLAAISLGNNNSERVDELLAKENSSSELFKDLNWICGTEDALIILSEIEKNQETIIKDKQKKLREIFEDAVKSYQYLPQIQWTSQII